LTPADEQELHYPRVEGRLIEHLRTLAGRAVIAPTVRRATMTRPESDEWFGVPAQPSKARYPDVEFLNQRPLPPKSEQTPVRGRDSRVAAVLRAPLGLVAIGLAVLAALVLTMKLGGPSAVLLVVGLLVVAAGIRALVRGKSTVLRIPGRKTAAAALVMGLLVVGAAGTAYGAGRPMRPAGTVPTEHTTAGASTPATKPQSSTGTSSSASTGASSSSASTTPGDAAAPAPGTALALLAALPIKGKAPLTGYARTAEFGEAWLDVDGNGCRTREDILRRDLVDVVRDGCRVQTGTLHDPYTRTEIQFVRGVRTSEAVQIDHVVALANAWQTGAQRLSQADRISLANDPVNLFAVDGPTNEAKGAGDAATWLPPNRSFRCTYVAHQVSVKAAYHLWVTRAEHDAIARVLSRCPSTGAPAESVDTAGADAAALVSESSTESAGAAAGTVPAPAVGSTTAYYANCSAVRAAGAAPIRAGQPGYSRKLDRDGDGVGCE
jgi:hypothetical protein